MSGQVSSRALGGAKAAVAKAVREATAKLDALEVVSAGLKEGSESMSYPMTGHYRVYTLRLVVENTGKASMILGDTCFLFETTSDGNGYDGVVQTRLPLLTGKRPGPFETRNRYVVNNAQHVDSEGEGKPVAPVGGGSTLGAFFMLLGAAIDLDDNKDTSFGNLWPQERAVLRHKYKLGAGLKPEFLAGLWCLSPVIFAADESRLPLGVVLCEFTNPDTAGKGNADGTLWKLSRTTILPLDRETLARRAQDSRMPAVMRVLALNLMAEYHAPEVVNVARTRLSTITEANGNVRCAAMEILGQQRDQGSISTLLKFVAPDQPAGIRRVAMSVLGKLQATQAEEALAVCARDADEDVAKAAIQALGSLGTASAVSRLNGFIEDKGYPHVVEVVQALGTAGAPAVPYLVRALGDARDRVPWAAASALGTLLQPETLKNLDGYDEEATAKRLQMRRQLDPALEAATANAALDALEKVIVGVSEEQAKTVLYQYRDIPGSRVSRFLLTAADTGRGPVAEVLSALAARREPDAGPRIMKYLRTTAPKETCRAAIDAAADLKLASATSALVALLGTAEEYVRASAATALGKLKAAAASEPLDAILRDASQPEYVRSQCLTSLKELPGGVREDSLLRVANAPADKLRWNCLEELCRSNSEQARAAVQRALADTDKDSSYRVDSLKRRWDTERGQRTMDLSERLASTEEDIRCEAVQEIIDKKDTRALAALKQILRTEHSAKVLLRLDRAFQILECRDRDLVPGYLAKLDLKDTEIQEVAAMALRRLTGRKLGPYDGESPAERAEDINIWRSCSNNLRK
jgi:HEAT repeat protein